MTNEKIIEEFIQGTIENIDILLRKVFELSNNVAEDARQLYPLRMTQYAHLSQQVTPTDKSAPLYQSMLSNIFGQNIIGPEIIDAFTINLLRPFIRFINVMLNDEKMKKIYGLH